MITKDHSLATALITQYLDQIIQSTPNTGAAGIRSAVSFTQKITDQLGYDREASSFLSHASRLIVASDDLAAATRP